MASKLRFKERKEKATPSSSPPSRAARPPKKRHRSEQHFAADDPSLYDDSIFGTRDPEAHFRESLFDAMADDEGADYWQGYYGEPIHTYKRPTDVMNEMSDDAYAEYVRQEMWKKKHEKENAKRRKDKRHAKERDKEWEAKREEQSREAQQREQSRQTAALAARWSTYLREMQDRQRIPWPVVSAEMSDVVDKNVVQFFHAAPGDLGVTIRKMKVFWHPDKARQRWGDLVTEHAAAKITLISQIVNDFHEL